MKSRIFILASLVAIVAFFSLSHPVRCQDLRIRPGDRIKLEVAQRQDLNRLLEVGMNGEIVLPIIGPVKVGGLAAEEARMVILSSLRELYPSIRDLSITLIGAESRSYIYVQGEVAQPGKYDFQIASNIWDAIREAGGATAAASLESVRLVHVEGDSTTTEYVDVQRGLDTGDLSTLPALRPGDTIIVPERSMAALSGSGAVVVVGAVANPARYNISGEKRLLDAILAAGGWTDYAALGRVTIIRPIPTGGSMTMKFDLRKYLKKGDPKHNPQIFPGDTVSVPRKNSVLAIFASPAFLLGIITTSATVTAIIATRGR